MSNGYSPYPYYPSMYPQSKGMNWAGIIAGLAALGIGGYVAYKLLNEYFKPQCTIDNDCPTGYVCDNGKCVEGCNNVSDCPDGYICVNNKCTPDTDCDSNSDCPPGSPYCYNGTCVQCTSDTHCPTGYKCLSNRCTITDIPCTGNQLQNFSCHSGITGMQRCDSKMNLCKCNGTQWSKIADVSPICTGNIRHNECFANPENYATCFYTMEEGTDNCQLNSCIGCPCNQTKMCDSTSYCCSDGTCQSKGDGATLLYATCPSNLTCWSEGTTRWARYDFDESGVTSFKKPRAFQQLTDLRIYIDGTQWGFWSLFVYYGYNGTQELFGSADWENACIFGCGSPLGPHTIIHSGGPICADYILIGIYSPTGPPNITGIGCRLTL